MLHNFLRSLGRPSHPTKRASRRKFSPNAQRSDAAIERLEERALLSAGTYEEYSSVRLFGTSPFKQDAIGNEEGFAGPLLAASDSIVAAYIYWQGVDLLSDGGDGVYDDSNLTVNGTVVTGEFLGASDSFGRGEGATGAFRADVSAFLQIGSDGPKRSVLLVSGMASKPGHSRDHVQLIVLYHSESLPGNTAWLRTSGIQSLQDVEGPFGDFTWYNPVQPVAANLNFTVTYVDGVYQGSVLQGEGTPQRLDQFELVQRPSVGFLLWGDSFDFYAPTGFEGHVSFTYRVRRGLLWSEPATVDVTVVQQSTVPPAPTTPPAPSTPPENHRPFAGSWLSVFHPSDDQLSFSERLRAFDDDGDALRFEVVSPPAVGTIRFDDGFVGSEGCVFTYIRPSGFIGEVFFTYRVFDGLEYSEAAPATISIRPFPAPKLEKQTVKGTQGQPVVAEIQWQDPNLNPVIVSLKTVPKVGTLVFDSKTLEFVYTPPKGFTGTVSFDCILFTRNAADIAIETVTIVLEPAVEPVGHKPQHDKPQHDKPQHDKPYHEKPHHEKPTVKTPTDHPAAQPQRQTATSSATGHLHATPNFLKSAQSGKHEGEIERPRSFPVGELIRPATIFAPPAADSDNARPAKITTVIYASDQMNVSRSLAHSLRLNRLDENSRDAANSERPISYDFQDINGDGREDLIAVFELDWAELWDGHESAVLTGRLV